jgi:hypothetical protein
MTDEAQSPRMSPDHDPRHRYLCNECRRLFTVSNRVSHEGGARCPACLGDNVTYWLSRRDRLMRFLMFYEAA